MGNKKISKEEELLIVEKYKNGTPVKNLQEEYGFATRKSITDKIKKYLTKDKWEKIKERNKENKKTYSYSIKKIDSLFDAYFIGLLMTDGYITTRGLDVGIDLTDEDCIAFLAKTINVKYHMYPESKSAKGTLDRYRLILSGKELVKDLSRFGIVQNKTANLQPPFLNPEEEKYIPYIIRGIIDGDGCISLTSGKTLQFYIISKSEDFIDWCKYILENKIYMKDIHKRRTQDNLWRIESADYNNILKLIAVIYDVPFGMNRKYTFLRKTFNDYNRSSLIIKDDCIV